MDWVEIRVSVNQDIKEGVANFLFEQKATGCIEEKDVIVAYFSANAYSEHLLARLNLYLAEIQQLGFRIEPHSVSVKQIENEEWDLNWRKNFKTLKITPRFVVNPPWIDYQPAANETVIEINPKMTFGTGSHATTKSMILLMERFLKPGKSVLDIGTGTGILAMVAWHLGARQIDAFDNDPVAVECALENARHNRIDAINFVTATISHFSGRLPKYDFILANIHKSVILEIINEIDQLQAANGFLIISGILIQQQAEVVQKIEALGFQSRAILNADEWAGIAFQKNESKHNLLI
jgi:ribosomal protein L11 methyltransferase